jgi:uncharacterized protein YqeY
MSLETKIMDDLKTAMKAKDQATMRGIRAIKSAILLFKTDGTGSELDDSAEIKILQKLIKQRQDSYDIYLKQNRNDLAVVEKEEMDVISKYLPAQLSQEELQIAINSIIATTEAQSMKDMGKVMAEANKLLAGKADGKSISEMVKKLLS